MPVGWGTSRRWALGALLSLIAVVLVALLPEASAAREAVQVVASLVAGVVTLVAAARMPVVLRWVWWPLALYLLLTVLADVAFVALGAIGLDPGYPNILDVVYLGSYLLGILGLLALGRLRGRGSDLATWIDAAIVSLAAGSVLAVLVLVPLVGPEATLDAATVVGLAYPLLDLLLLTVLLQVMWSQRGRSLSLSLLAASMITYLVADAGFNVAITGWWSSDSPLLDAAYLAANLLLALSITATDARTIDTRLTGAESETGGGRLLVLLGAAILIPVMGLLLDSSNQHALSRLVNAFAIAIICLLVLRVFLLLRTTRHQAALLAGQARTDSLTGLPNRRTWDYQGNRVVAEADRTGEPLVVAMIDVDHFKRYNDTHGHQAGDAILAHCARNWSRALDGRGFLARYGGEEFALLLTHPARHDTATVLEDVRAATPSPLTASIGYAERLPGESVVDTVRRADVALYAAKGSGRNRVVAVDAEQEVPEAVRPVPPLPSEDDPLLGPAGLLTLVLDNASDIVYRTVGLSIEWISPSVTKLLGWLPEDLVGSPASLLVSPHQDLDWMARNRERLYAGETVYQELLLQAKDGSERWFAGTAHPHYDGDDVVGFVVSMNDIHGRWLARSELQTMEQLVRVAAGSASQGVAFLDAGMIMLQVNASLRRFLGRSTNQLVGQPWLSVVDAADLGFQAEMFDRLCSGLTDTFRVTSRFTRPDGAVAHGEVTVAAARAADRSLSRIVVQVIDVSDEQAEQNRVLELTRIDPVTGLLTRTATLNRLDELIEDRPVPGPVAGILLVEVNNMGLINESLGHEVGDQVLRASAGRLVTAVPADAVVGRSGKRFLVILPAVIDPRDVQLLAVEIQLSLGVPMEVDGRSLAVTCSIGHTVARTTDSAASVLRNVHVAVGAARRAGPEGIVAFAEELAESAQRRMVVEEELRVACRDGQFVIEYQPIVDLATGQAQSFEALVRWEHPEVGLRPPTDFLDVAEQSRLIRPIGRMVLEQACRDLRDYPEVLPHVAVNVSAVEIDDPEWLAGFVEVVRESGVDGRRLTVEVTETAVFTTARDVHRDFELLRGMGIGVHLDDFGTGYSSLSVLRQLPATGLKLDRSFVSTLGESHNLAEGLVHLVSALDLAGIAEGIETPEQAARLRSMGWSLGQGYLFGRPARLDRWRAVTD